MLIISSLTIRRFLYALFSFLLEQNPFCDNEEGEDYELELWSIEYESDYTCNSIRDGRGELASHKRVLESGMILGNLSMRMHMPGMMNRNGTKRLCNQSKISIQKLKYCHRASLKLCYRRKNMLWCRSIHTEFRFSTRSEGKMDNGLRRLCWFFFSVRLRLNKELGPRHPKSTGSRRKICCTAE